MNQTKYSIWQNARYVIKDFWGWQKRLIIMSIVRIPLIVVLPLLSAFIPKVIIEIMENGGGASQLLIAIPIMTLITIILYIAEKIAHLWVGDIHMRARYRYLIRIN